MFSPAYSCGSRQGKAGRHPALHTAFPGLVLASAFVPLVRAATELPGTASDSLRARGRCDCPGVLKWQSAAGLSMAVTTKLIYAK